jgi:hypothetical protein
MMRFSLVVELSGTVPDIFMHLHNPAVFKKVSRPFLTFTPVSPREFPAHFVSGGSYVVRVRALGLIPLGTQEINPLSTMGKESSVFRDNGRGRSGSLRIVRHFCHTMTLSPVSHNRSLLRDELEWDAGALSPLFWIGFRIFWSWRHSAMKRLAKTW